MDNIDLIRKLVIVSLKLHTNKITSKQNPPFGRIDVNGRKYYPDIIKKIW
jgi:hypothetical protein